MLAQIKHMSDHTVTTYVRGGLIVVDSTHYDADPFYESPYTPPAKYDDRYRVQELIDRQLTSIKNHGLQY